MIIKAIYLRGTGSSKSFRSDLSLHFIIIFIIESTKIWNINHYILCFNKKWIDIIDIWQN